MEKGSRDVLLASTVGLVHGKNLDLDSAAETLVRKVLHESGVKNIVVTDGAEPRGQLTIWLGSVMPTLATFGVDLTAGLAPGGFVFAAGLDSRRHGHIMLCGADPAGTFYAAQALGSYVQHSAEGAFVPRTVRRESPAMAHRGLIEGFYGTPWSHADRLDLIDYLGRHRMNTFVYAPKDDQYHRENWRDPYPPAELARLEELVSRARASYVDFMFALSPGLSIRYTSDADFHALTAKFDVLYDLGVRAFCIPFDDIDYDTWHSAADLADYGTGSGPAGRAHSDLLNRVLDEWAAARSDIARLHMVPTEYFNVTETPYKKALRERLDPGVIIHWTGIGVIPSVITREQTAEARRVFGHDILIWDNVPANDYLAGRIPLGTYTGREPGLSNEVVGLISNPMNQAAASKVALYSFGEFCWDDRSFDAPASWTRALAERAGGDSETTAALAWLADLSWFDGTLHHARAPRLAREIATFWNLWRSGRTKEAAERLAPTLGRLATVAETIRRGADPAFVADVESWLEATGLWTAAMVAALDSMVQVDAANPALAWDRRQHAAESMAQAKRIRDGRDPHSRTYPRIADGVADAFVNDAAQVFERAIGIGTGRPTAWTSLGTWSDLEPALVLDGDPMTYFQSNRAPRAGDHLTIDLGRIRPIGAVTVHQTHLQLDHDYLRAGVIECSVDGRDWTELTRATTPEVTASVPAGATARYVRLRALADNDPHWLVVREFGVRTLDATALEVDGLPEPARGSELSDAADDDLESSYVAARRPGADEALTVTLSRPRVIAGLVVLQHRGDVACADVEVRTTSGEWLCIGRLDAAYTCVDVADHTDAAVVAVRLVWTPGTPPPRVADIIPRFAD